jgi:hypothetical protein
MIFAWNNSTREPPVVFLDTSVLKHSADRLIRGRSRKVTRYWGETPVTMDVTQFVEVYPNARVRGPLIEEFRFLPLIADLAKTARVRLVTHAEVRAEFWRLPKTDDPRGQFYGAPIEWGPDPLTYGRIMAGWSAIHKTDPQLDFVKGITHPRFQELRLATGANPDSGTYRNQLLDAFHIWCAEAASAKYFLTTDLKLVRLISRHKSHPPACRVVTPAQLIKALIANRDIRVRDAVRFVIRSIRARRHPESNDPSEQLLALGKRLEKDGYFDSKK